MDIVVILAAIGFLVVAGIIFGLLVPKINRLKADFDSHKSLLTSHMAAHRQAEDKEARRLQAVEATFEALKGMRFAILHLYKGRDGWEVSSVISHGQPLPPYDDTNDFLDMRRWLGITNPEHRQFNVTLPDRVVVMHPANFTPTKGLKLTDDRIKVIAGTVLELVPAESPDLAVAVSLERTV